MRNLTTEETVKLGEVFERLRVNPDYVILRKWVFEQVQDITTRIVNTIRKTPEDFVNAAFDQGQNIGLAEPEGYMLKIIQLMKEEKARLAKEKQNARGHSKR